MSGNKAKWSLFEISGMTILFTALGYFVYDGITGAIAILIFALIISILKYLGIVPILGPIAYWILAKQFIIPNLFALTGIYETWLTGLIFWFGFALSLIFTIIILVLIVIWIFESRF